MGKQRCYSRRMILDFFTIQQFHFFNENQSKIIKQAKLTYSPCRKAFEKQTKSIRELEEKQIDVIKDQGKNKLNL